MIQSCLKHTKKSALQSERNSDTWYDLFGYWVPFPSFGSQQKQIVRTIRVNRKGFGVDFHLDGRPCRHLAWTCNNWRGYSLFTFDDSSRYRGSGWSSIPCPSECSFCFFCLRVQLICIGMSSRLSSSGARRGGMIV